MQFVTTSPLTLGFDDGTGNELMNGGIVVTFDAEVVFDPSLEDFDDSRGVVSKMGMGRL